MPTRRCYNCMNELVGEAKICPACGFDNSLYVQPDEALSCGTVLRERYMIGRVLGQGGFGLTYIGYDQALGTPVCIKEYFPAGGAMRGQDGSTKVRWSAGSTGTALKEGRETFVEEAKKAARVRSLNSVVSVWDVFDENDTSYIVMEYVNGVTLKEYLIIRGTVMDTEECLRLLLPVIHDLQRVHEKGIVHRDISPDNLMIREDEKVMLLDLGAAKDLMKGKEQSSMLVHKKGFSPPEQYTEGTKIGPWTDVYAMCATIYWCMTGKNVPDAMDRMMGDSPEYPESMPEALKAVLEHGLEVKPSDRIQDMEELERGLEEARRAIIPPPPRPWEDPKKKTAGAKKPSEKSKEPSEGPKEPTEEKDQQLQEGKQQEEKTDEHTPKPLSPKCIIAALAVVAAVLIAVFWIGPFSPKGSLDKLKKKAEQGDAAAQNDLGFAYYKGDGVEQDYENAELWFLKAADQGFAEAQNNLGDLFYYGVGVDKNYDKAAEWYAKSAEQENAEGQLKLGFCYQKGLGVEQSNEKAVELYEKAAGQGYAEANAYLGYCYKKGLGVDLDYEKAAALCKEAIEQGSLTAEYFLADCYFGGLGVEQDYEKMLEGYRKIIEKVDSSGQKALNDSVYYGVGEDRDLQDLYTNALGSLGYCYEEGLGTDQDYEAAMGWYTKAAEKENGLGLCYLGICYRNGVVTDHDAEKAIELFTKAADQGYADGQWLLGDYYYFTEEEQDFEKAVRWYEKAVEQGHTTAQYGLGNCYYFGNGVEQDYEKAAELFARSAEQGYETAQDDLGYCYENGKGVTQDYDKAAEWYEKGAVQGDASAQCNLGRCYYNGNGKPQDYEKAVEWYEKAAEQGSADAQTWLGHCYSHGNGVPQDDEKAVEWYTKAAEQGHATAQYNLGFCYEHGQGVPQDYQKAAEWYEKAAEQGYEDAIKKLEELKEKGVSPEPQASSNKMSKEKFTGWADRTVKEVVFLNTLDGAPSDAEDLSEEGDRSVLGWKDGETLYIAGEGGVKAPEDCSYLFSDGTANKDESKRWANLNAVRNAEYYDVSDVTNMNYMFFLCGNLKELNAGSWDTSKVTQANGMFSMCSSLADPGVGHWNTSNFETMQNMFVHCYSFIILDLSSWDTSKVTNMSNMFSQCINLQELKLADWDTSKVTDMSHMFWICGSLTDLDVSKWDTSSLEKKDDMFGGTEWENDPPI